MNNIVFRSNQETNVTFPFALDYQASNDPNYQVLTSLAEKCGVNGGAQSPITVNYKITVRLDFHMISTRFTNFIIKLGLEILFFVVSPVVSNSVSFACPASAQQIEVSLGWLATSDQ